jgi:transposase
MDIAPGLAWAKEDPWMARRTSLVISEADRIEILRDRYEHPHPRVQQRMEVLWLISQGVGYDEAARLGDVSPATVDRIVSIYRRGGLETVRQLNWHGHPSELEGHRQTLEESFREQPPHTVNEACVRIEELTGLKRRPTQVRQFLKKLSA